MKTISEFDYNLIISAKENNLFGVLEYMKVYYQINYYLDSRTLYYHLTESAFRILELNELKNLFENGIEKQIREKIHKKENPTLGYDELCQMIIDKFQNLRLTKIDEDSKNEIPIYNILFHGKNLTYSEYEQEKVLKK